MFIGRLILYPPATGHAQEPEILFDYMLQNEKPTAVPAPLEAQGDSIRRAADDPGDLPGDDSSRTAIRYRANSIEYDVRNSLIQLSGDAQVRYKDIKVVGDTIEFDTKRQALTVRKDPVLYDRSDSIYGDRMVYDFKARRGWIYNGRTKFDRGRYWGKKIRQVGDRTLNIDYGKYTTCDADTPHFYFWSRRMKIYLDDKIIAAPVVLCFSDVPVLAIPFWFFPLRRDRHSGFMMPRFGSSAYEGVFAKNIAYYQVINDQADATVAVDMLEKVGWRGNFEARYIWPRKISSNLNFSYLEDKNPVRKRWNLNGSYQQTVGKRTSISGSGNFISDKYYFQEFSDDRELRMNRNLHSYFSFNHSWNQASLRAAVDHYDNLDLHTTTSRLPEVSVNLYQKELIPKILNMSGSSYLLALRTSDSVEVNNRQGWNNRAEIGSSFKLLKWVNINPRATLSGTWYDRDVYEKKNAWLWLYSGGLSASTTLYGLLPVKIGPLQGFRHMLQPSVSYSYAPYIDQSRFASFGSIGGLSQTKSMSLSLNNTFQTKYPKGKDMAKLDLLAVSLSSGYNFLAQSNKWSNVTMSANALPGNRYLDCRVYSYYDVYTRQPQYTSLYLGLRLSGNWLSPPQKAIRDTNAVGPDTLSKAEDIGDSLQLGKNSDEPSDSLELEESPADSIDQKPAPIAKSGLPWSFNLTYDQNWRQGQAVSDANLRGYLNFNITRNWKISYGQYYDIKTGEIVSEDYSVYRDLHCWEARFSSTRSGVYWSYEFRINLKAIPELKIHIPKSGSVSYQ